MFDRMQCVYISLEILREEVRNVHGHFVDLGRVVHYRD